MGEPSKKMYFQSINVDIIIYYECWRGIDFSGHPSSPQMGQQIW